MLRENIKIHPTKMNVHVLCHYKRFVCDSGVRQQLLNCCLILSRSSRGTGSLLPSQRLTTGPRTHWSKHLSFISTERTICTQSVSGYAFSSSQSKVSSPYLCGAPARCLKRSILCHYFCQCGHIFLGNQKHILNHFCHPSLTS